ncbi:MAG: pepsin-like aspartic protease [Myxococcales bacterium]|nr:pepsin-like aspartic protease [Myxococcales bacterium]
MSKVAKIPITNAISGGDYTAAIEMGPEKHPANVILDTGSSTLAVWRSQFGKMPTTPTNYVQFVAYGTGSWAGPLLEAQIGLGTGAHYIDLQDTQIAQIQSGELGGKPMFYPADGILGLAYRSLNTAADVGPDFPLRRYNTLQKWNALSQDFTTLDPWMVNLVKAHEVANVFAFLTRRSAVDYSTPQPATNPLNQGWFVLGGGEQFTELYQGEFKSAAVVADEFYNVRMLEIQVGDQAPIPVPTLAEVHEPTGQDSSHLRSNAIVDSGTNSIQMFSHVYSQMVQSFANLNPAFALWISAAQGDSVPLKRESLAQWPSIFVTLGGVDGPTRLEMKPDTYWQVNARRGGGALFKISPSSSPQSILGLPLMNNYYVVFDRSAANGKGLVKFAAQASG